MKFPHKWFKDVIVVRFVDNGYKGDVLVLPSDIKHAVRIVEAEVIAVGAKCKEPLVAGDRVLVDSYMGTRRKFDDIGEACTYDTEDVYAKLV